MLRSHDFSNSRFRNTVLQRDNDTVRRKHGLQEVHDFRIVQLLSQKNDYIIRSFHLIWKDCLDRLRKIHSSFNMRAIFIQRFNMVAVPVYQFHIHSVFCHIRAKNRTK